MTRWLYTRYRYTNDKSDRLDGRDGIELVRDPNPGNPAPPEIPMGGIIPTCCQDSRGCFYFSRIFNRSYQSSFQKPCRKSLSHADIAARFSNVDLFAVRLYHPGQPTVGAVTAHHQQRQQQRWLTTPSSCPARSSPLSPSACSHSCATGSLAHGPKAKRTTCANTLEDRTPKGRGETWWERLPPSKLHSAEDLTG
jgi:hypothetical protein